MIGNTTLIDLDLNNNTLFSDYALRPIAMALQYNSHLRKISMSSGLITHLSVNCLFDCLSKSAASNLKEIDLSNNLISNSIVLSLCTYLVSKNSKMQYLNLSKNMLTTVTSDALMEINEKHNACINLAENRIFGLITQVNEHRVWKEKSLLIERKCNDNVKISLVSNYNRNVDNVIITEIIGTALRQNDLIFNFEDTKDDYRADEQYKLYFKIEDVLKITLQKLDGGIIPLLHSFKKLKILEIF